MNLSGFTRLNESPSQRDESFQIYHDELFDGTAWYKGLLSSPSFLEILFGTYLP